MDDGFCDPIELRGESFLGVAGLVEAVRAGNVAVANAIGQRVIETAAHYAVSARAFRRLLGEALKLPSVATWWCGQDQALGWVLDHLNRVVVKPAFPQRGMEPIFGAQLATAETRKIGGPASRRPYDYVAQEEVALSTAPVWDAVICIRAASSCAPTFSTRAMAGLQCPAAWFAFPAPKALSFPCRRAGTVRTRGCCGTGRWIPSACCGRAINPSNCGAGRVDLPSRAADNLFWLGRYAERAECIARLLRCLMTRVRRVSGPELSCLFRLHGCFDSEEDTLPEGRHATARELEAELISLMSDGERTGSLASTLSELQRVGGNSASAFHPTCRGW